VPQKLEVILFGLLSVAALLATHYVLGKTVRKLSSSVVQPSILRVLRPILNVYYRRKLIQQIQTDRKAKGLPPLENQHIL